MPYSAGTTDPLGFYVLAWIPVALALVGAAIALFPAAVVFLLELLARRRHVPALEPNPAT
jgi:uncharacterized membrane protein YbaN (DUF454 family)